MRMAIVPGRLSATALLLAALAVAPPAAYAAATQERSATSDGIKGLVVNQTITPNGNAFYLGFTELWREKPDGEDYALAIVERPSKRYGNQVIVYFGQRRVHAGFVPFKFDQIRSACEKAVEESYANIVATKLDFLTPGDPDIVTKDEF